MKLRLNIRQDKAVTTRRRLWPRRLARVGLWSLAIMLLVFIALDTVIFPLPVEKLRRAEATFIYSQDQQLINAYASDDYFWRIQNSLDEISPRLVESIIDIEDRYFRYHPGVNPVSIISAAVTNIKAGKVVRGGSTLTMQIARMIEPKERTVVNKLLEIFRALQLEWRFSKDELLEIYFNLAPYGGNVEGVGAASYFYFHKEPSDLTWAEAALLVAIPCSPERFRPDVNNERARKRRDWILSRLAAAGLFDEDQLEFALEEIIPNTRAAAPKAAPHFCQALAARYPDSGRLVSSVDYNVQLLCERSSRAYLERLRAKDIHNLAVVVLDNSTGRILGMVGSPDMNDAQHDGQVNGALAPRSPGSALKPFLYALAFDRGLLAAEQKVADIPVNYNGYRPVNYDEKFHGMVSVREALVHSYNIPAVNAAAELGLSSIHSFLRMGGITTLDKEYPEYGLPLVLGAVEVRLLELTNLYASLARGGNFKPISWLVTDSDSGSIRILSEEACYLTTDILTGLRRPDLPTSWKSVDGRMPVAWKTGTSYGRRDAWAIGYTPRYTVGVWAGNFDGKGSVNLVGAEISAPLMFDIFNSLEASSKGRGFLCPVNIDVRQVCAVSGLPVSKFCPETTEEIYAVGKSPIAKCNVHRPIIVDSQTGLRLRAACAQGIEHEQCVVEIWPARVATWMVTQGLTRPLPEYHPICLEVPVGDGPVIVSPPDGSVYELAGELPVDYQKISFEASTATGSGKVHWFLDGELFASAGTDERVFYVPRSGSHVLICTDNDGRSSKVNFVVKSAYGESLANRGE